VLEELERELDIKAGDTTPDKEYMLETVKMKVPIFTEALGSTEIAQSVYTATARRPGQVCKC
jgi:hypothetical protein